MSYDQTVAQRVRDVFADGPSVDEKAMFGGLAFMLDGKMCCGIIESDLVLRIGPEQAETALSRAHVRPMDFTGKPMKGYVYVAPAGYRDRRSLESWINMAVQFVSTLSRSPSRKRASPQGRLGRSPVMMNTHSKKGVRR